MLNRRSLQGLPIDLFPLFDTVSGLGFRAGRLTDASAKVFSDASLPPNATRGKGAGKRKLDTVGSAIEALVV